MNNLQRTGGIAALVEAATYLIGMVLLFTVLAPTLNLAPGPYVAFIADNQTLMHGWILLSYLVNAAFLVVLAQALYQRLRGGAPALAQAATAFGLIWAGLVFASGMLTITNMSAVVDLYASDPQQAAATWLALSAVQNGLGGGIELPGGLWLLLVSWAALRTGSLPRLLNYFGLLVGAAGVLTALPGLSELVSVFGLGAIAWFITVGIAMLRGSADEVPEKPLPVRAAYSAE